MTTKRYRLGQAIGIGILVVTLSGCQHADAQSQEQAAAGNGAMGNGAAVMLSGRQQVPPVSSSAAGTAMIEVAPDRTVSGKVTYSGVDATVAHIHQGSRGSNGPPVVPLTKVSDSAFEVPQGARLTEEQYEQYKKDNLYVNIHSQRYPGGELRAQLQPE
jgi:hypothetical protein